MLDERGKRKLRLALAIISGRRSSSDFVDEWELMGYDPYKFSTYGTPSTDEAKQWAEDCVLLNLRIIADEVSDLQRRLLD